HLTSLDGRSFDSMSLGEFIYLQPKASHTGVTVQVRQEPISANSIARNTAIAIKADGTIFEFRVGSPFTQPYINHAQQSLTPGLYVFGDADLKINSDTSAELIYKDYHISFGGDGRFLGVHMDVPLDDTHMGMLGQPNGNSQDDWAMPDGSPA